MKTICVYRNRRGDFIAFHLGKHSHASSHTSRAFLCSSSVEHALQSSQRSIPVYFMEIVFLHPLFPPPPLKAVKLHHSLTTALHRKRKHTARARPVPCDSPPYWNKGKGASKAKTTTKTQKDSHTYIHTCKKNKHTLNPARLGVDVDVFGALLKFAHSKPLRSVNPHQPTSSTGCGLSAEFITQNDCWQQTAIPAPWRGAEVLNTRAATAHSPLLPCMQPNALFTMMCVKSRSSHEGWFYCHPRCACVCVYLYICSNCRAFPVPKLCTVRPNVSIDAGNTVDTSRPTLR